MPFRNLNYFNFQGSEAPIYVLDGVSAAPLCPRFDAELRQAI